MQNYSVMNEKFHLRLFHMLPYVCLVFLLQIFGIRVLGLSGLQILLKSGLLTSIWIFLYYTAVIKIYHIQSNPLFQVNSFVGTLMHIHYIAFFNQHSMFQGISLVGTLMTVSPVTLRVVSLWLVMVQALVLPHCMWLFNRRYRAALGHVADWFRCRVGFYTEGIIQHCVMKLQILDCSPGLCNETQ